MARDPLDHNDEVVDVAPPLLGKSKVLFGYYNYVRVHSTIKTTPAVAQGLASKPWSIAELLTAAA